MAWGKMLLASAAMVVLAGAAAAQNAPIELQWWHAMTAVNAERIQRPHPLGVPVTPRAPQLGQWPDGRDALAASHTVMMHEIRSRCQDPQIMAGPPTSNGDATLHRS